MKPVSIVVGGRLPAPGPELLQELGALRYAENDALHTLAPLLAEADVLIARATTRVGAELLDLAPRLRVVARTGVGVDLIDLAAVRARGVAVLVAPDASTHAVAEGALTLLLALAKRLPELDRIVRSGDWPEREHVTPRELGGASLAVIGYGQIGRRVAQLASAFGMDVLAVDPALEGAGRVPDHEGVRPLGLRAALERADYASLHLPLTSLTRGMIDLSLLESAKPGLVLVNLSRGGIAPLDVLEAALDRGLLRGVGLDVFDPEPPPPSHPLFRRPNVICTPHTLGLTSATWRRMFETLRDDLSGVLAGASARNPAS